MARYQIEHTLPGGPTLHIPIPDGFISQLLGAEVREIIAGLLRGDLDYDADLIEALEVRAETHERNAKQ